MIAEFRAASALARGMNNSRRLVFPALVGAGVLWGTTVPLSKVALGWLPPAWLAFGRFAIAAIVLMAVSGPRLRAACKPAILVTGAIGYGGSVLLQNIGIERTSVTHAALLIGATPVLVAIMAATLGHSVARPLAWAGFMLSLAGVGLIAGGQGHGSTMNGDALVLAAQLVSAGFTVSQARLLRGQDPIAVTALQLAAAGLAMLPFALVTEALPTSTASLAQVLAFAGLTLAGTVGPTTLFAFAQSRVSADVAGAFLNLEPLVGAAAGTALFGDPVGAVQLGGGAAIVTGIVLSSFQVVRAERVRRAAGASVVQSQPASELAVVGSRSEARSCPPRPASGEAPSMVRRTRWPVRPGYPARSRRRRLRQSAKPRRHRVRPARTVRAGRPRPLRPGWATT